ncbi:hypothetical protein G6N74_29465 [Mesorhizobium sp. CGMCC 1.15528]|uniref:Uncharacterized protein n=1 Tax=Mesorhizobium zhangyense TaxID=1776730 RepID=A0A7C9VAP9_9HYPH|nr:hypothetical protein [Mesorhizobium zhangyense]NGN45185.1 hypothetical protein [Mesorhizobium zhangyense]
MAITYPYNFLDLFPGWATEFDVLYRQEQSRTAGGRTIVKDLGSPLWTATFQSRSMQPNELDEWRARMKALEGGTQEFRAWPTSRCYPIAYPNGVGMGTVSGAQVNSIAANRKTISLKGLPVGYTDRIGDYIQIGTSNLHQVLEAATANGSGVTGTFEVRPHLWPLSAVNDAVTVVKPSCLMTQVPGSLSTTAELQTGRGTITFQAVESR